MRNADFLAKFDTVLNIADPDFTTKFLSAIGAKQGDTLEIMTPQFERTDRREIKPLPFDFAQLSLLSEAQLKKLGCGKWDSPDANGEVLWLLPYQWYDHIPEGTQLVCIDGETEAFQHGKTDGDSRFGLLAYGFKRKADTAKA